MAYHLLRFEARIGYQDGLDMQREIVNMVAAGVIDGALLILEHKPVLTMGIRTDQNNLLVDNAYLRDAGVELFETDRGGDITFHGPGQIVAYPILKFRAFGLRLSDYMHRLEQVVIDTLADYDVEATSRPEFPGVWVDDRKLCAIGVRAKQFITSHGLAFNVHTDLTYFNLINPCGITEYQVGRLADYRHDVDIEQVKDRLIGHFNKRFGVTFEPTTLNELRQRK